ncbi:unnamed protein product [Withania somnifera]
MAQQGNSSNVPMSIVTRPACIQFHRWGNCSSGERCPYIHIAGGSMYGPLQRIEVAQGNPGKMAACRYFSSGNVCPYGNACQFLHEGGRAEYRESAAITIATTAGHEARKRTRSDEMSAPKRPVGTPVNMPEPRRHVRTPFEMLEPEGSVDSRKRLKTRFCTKWERTGTCFYGSFCQFSHGAAELQSVGSSYPQQLGTSASISAPAKFLAPNEEGPSVPSEKRLRFEWDNVYKIAEVYGDWIESPPRAP